jgi:transposase
LGADPFSGAVYVFRAKRADRIKLLFWDGTGLCVFGKRLENGIFRWPKIEDGVMHLTAAQLSALLEGLDWRRFHTPRETVTPFGQAVTCCCGKVSQSHLERRKMLANMP